MREAVAAAPEPKRPPPKLGPANPLVAQPRAPSSGVARPRTGWGYAIAWALGIGVGAVAAGAFVGFLVNGAPGHSASHRQVADVSPPTPVPPPTAQEIVESNRATTTVATASVPETAAPTAPVSSAPAASARTVLPPIPLAKPAPQAAPPPSAPSSSAPPSSAQSPRLSTSDVREVQGRLQSLGFDPGPVDGAAGPKTAAAVARYQEAHGLQSTGVADTATLDELRREPGSTPPPPPPPPRPRPQQASQYAYTPPPQRQSNPLLDALHQLFG
ncbi:MAG: peptidoglycan-binding protein, partial [Alphaproteobacteria bacterium]|nr:peptidoglycan-binding protein [Alphaproteobacteria bacterium]